VLFKVNIPANIIAKSSLCRHEGMELNLNIHPSIYYKMAGADNDYPVLAESEGIKIKTEKMVVDKLYHCIYDNKVFLFYKDEESLLHCYEVQNPEAVKEIEQNPSQINSILQKRANIN
jgi:hypothetical protein